MDGPARRVNPISHASPNTPLKHGNVRDKFENVINKLSFKKLYTVFFVIKKQTIVFLSHVNRPTFSIEANDMFFNLSSLKITYFIFQILMTLYDGNR